MSTLAQRNTLFWISVLGALGTLVMVGRLAGTVEAKLEAVIQAVAQKDRHDEAQDKAIHMLERETAVIGSRIDSLSGRVLQKANSKVAQTQNNDEQDTN
jgi:VIT1/CCC1 family predicted Fe2+/Mn2+ transporter